MKDKELRKLIGSRAKQRRVELGLNQPYVAEKMGVATSTIVRYEAGTCPARRHKCEPPCKHIPAVIKMADRLQFLLHLNHSSVFAFLL